MTDEMPVTAGALPQTTFSGENITSACSELAAKYLSLAMHPSPTSDAMDMLYLLYFNVGVLVFTIVAGTIGNCLVFLSMFVEERLVTCVNGLHGNLAMTDAINCMFGASLHLARLFINHNHLAFSIATRALEFLLYYNISASCLSTMALSFLKYWKLTHPLNKQPCKVIYLTMFLVQMTAILLGVSSLFEKSRLLPVCHDLLPSLDYPMFSILFILIPLFVLSILLSACLKVASLLALRREELTINKLMARIQTQEQAVRNDFTGATGAFCIMLAVQIVCYVPFITCYIYKAYYPLAYTVAESVVTCLMCSCAINPFLYTLRCYTYRKTLRHKLFTCGKGAEPTPATSEESGMTDSTRREALREIKSVIGRRPSNLQLPLDGIAITPTSGDNISVQFTIPKSPVYLRQVSKRSSNAFEKNCPCNVFESNPMGNDDLKL